jgi:hypothetical protein
MCLTTVPRISLYVAMRFFVYFLCFLVSYYPEQLRHVTAHVCLMSHRQTGNIRSFILEHIVLNNQNCTVFRPKFSSDLFFHLEYALSRRQT